MFTSEEAAIIVKNQYGINGSATLLPGEHDINFRVEADNGLCYLLKISSSHHDENFLQMQNDIMQQVAATGMNVPILRPTIQGNTIAKIAVNHVRLFSYLPGKLLGTLPIHSSALLKNLGSQLGLLTKHMQGISAPAAKRYLKWDLQQCTWVSAAIAEMTDAEDKACLQYFMDRFQAVLPQLPKLRQSIIHGDLNDYNILVDKDVVTGIIDFGDVVQSATITELAVALAYVMFNKIDPIAAAMTVIEAYSAQFPLREEEVAVLFELIAMRLCISVLTAAARRQEEPDNQYLVISLQPAWSLLRQLRHINPCYALYCFRGAAGFEACPNTPRIVQWLQCHRDEIASVVQPDLTKLNKLIFDLTATGAEVITYDGYDAAIGRYNEARLIYSSEQYQVMGNEGGEARTIHLGIDIFMPAGTAIYAPLAGRVFQLADNAMPQDYGPTIILAHHCDDLTFYTLYGHLSRETLSHLSVGQEIKAGQLLGWMGDELVNGGWPPHLHLQLMTDMLEHTSNYPGVAAASKRKVWLSLCPDANLLTKIPETELRATQLSTDTIKSLRKKHLPANLALAYQEPLHIIRGDGASLFDVNGKRYLDCVNNVCHVGHCHPRVVQAAHQQMSQLNTNTRYLHENMVRYAEQLVAKLPSPLEVCYFVSSGSEANELALRLAEHYTGRSHWVVMDHGYYGHTTQLINLSPYKFNGKGGCGKPAHVTIVPQLDKRFDKVVPLQFSDKVAGLICEALPSCGGQVILPDGYLQELYRAIRAVGGVCIADEIQTGLGRLGEFYWGFESQQVIPDIVTMGKPLGNGHPIGVVVTTRAIADRFNNGMEFFSTFGGNPVSAAIGSCVLTIIEEERLQQHAHTVGQYLLSELRQLQQYSSVITDVRGMGFFIGIELAAHANTMVERMRERGVLLSLDGPNKNVIKFKPPLVFSQQDADFFIAQLTEVVNPKSLLD